MSSSKDARGIEKEFLMRKRTTWEREERPCGLTIFEAPDEVNLDPVALAIAPMYRALFASCSFQKLLQVGGLDSLRHQKAPRVENLPK